jgi:hypothetical protein
MIEQCLPMSSRRYYIRLRAQKWEQAMARHKEQLTSLRREIAARNALPSGQDILAEWKLSEEFIGEMAVALVDAALESLAEASTPKPRLARWAKFRRTMRLNLPRANQE